MTFHNLGNPVGTSPARQYLAVLVRARVWQAGQSRNVGTSKVYLRLWVVRACTLPGCGVLVSYG
jgi:hypothetical protein